MEFKGFFIGMDGFRLTFLSILIDAHFMQTLLRGKTRGSANNAQAS